MKTKQINIRLPLETVALLETLPTNKRTEYINALIVAALAPDKVKATLKRLEAAMILMAIK